MLCHASWMRMAREKTSSLACLKACARKDEKVQNGEKVPCCRSCCRYRYGIGIAPGIGFLYLEI